MAYFSARRLTIAKDPALKKGDNYQLTQLFLLEDHNKKNDNGEWERIGSSAFPAVVFGDKAIEAAMLPKGTQITVMPEQAEGKNGTYTKFKAQIKDNSYTNKKTGEKITSQQVTLFDWEVIENNK